MDAYPEAFLSHLQPCIHAAGLGKAADNADKKASDGQQEAKANGTAVDDLGTLKQHLRKALTARTGRHDVWDPSRGSSTDFYNVVLVETDARFPPRKAKPAPASSAATNQQQTHSPISPLTPSSPLHPDGIIAPIWVRKHRELLPSAFLLIATLWEPDIVAPKSPLDVEMNGESSQHAEVERQKDIDLIQYILERKRLTNERGIKLAVILLASKRLLDSSSLDYRLSIIRRQSGLDSRASLFVISPVPYSDVQSFVSSLKNELYESIVDYYREHGRRVRRKKSRVPSVIGTRPLFGTNASASADASQAPPSPLTAQGWSVRYDYKLGAFAEIRQEFEVALKHYEDCYNALLDLFGNGSSLPPRTKRWAEAKVLADCVNAKICKFYLYNDEPSRVMAQHNKHLYRFRTLCENWQIGTGTYEFWSWSTKQYRLLADLIEVAIRGGYRLTAPKLSTTVIKSPQNPQSQILATGSRASVALQHAGHYYYLAALCAIQRRDLFRQAELEGKEDPSPAFAHEKTVNHTEQILELFTKAYELFKRYRATRMGLLIAYQIAITHTQADNYAMALRFFERIAKSYRKEHWRKLFSTVLEQTYVNAQLTTAPPSAFTSGFELMSPLAMTTLCDKPKIASTLLADLRNKLPSENQAKMIRIEPSEGLELVTCSGSFSPATAHVGSIVNFHLRITLVDLPLQEMTFDSMRITFGDDRGEILLLKMTDSDSGIADEDIKLPTMTMGAQQVSQHASCCLNWRPKQSRVFLGSLISETAASIEIKSVVLSSQIGEWATEIAVRPNRQSKHLIEYGQVPTLACQIQPRPLSIKVSLEAQKECLLGESVSLTLVLQNDESEAVDDIELSALLTSPRDASDIMTMEGENGTNLKGIKIANLLPSESRRIPITLKTSDKPGTRRVAVAARTSRPENVTTFSASANATIAHEHPFLCSCAVAFRRSRPSESQRSDSSGDASPDPWQFAAMVDLDFHFTKDSEIPICISSMTLKHTDSTDVKSVWQSWSEEDLPVELNAENEASFYSCLAVLGEQEVDTGQLEVVWRRSSESENTITTLISLPSLSPPYPILHLLARYPPFARPHQSVTFEYDIVNPTSSTVHVTVASESSENWVLAGARKIARLSVAPKTTHTVSLNALAVNRIGYIPIPRLRVSELLPPLLPDDAEEGGEEGDTSMADQPRLQLVPVYAEGSAVSSLDEEEDTPLSVYIMP